MTTTLDYDRYNSNQDMNIEITLMNSGIEKDVIVDVWIEDENGDAVTLLDTLSANLEYGLKKNYTLVWNIGSNYAGSYRIRATLKNIPDILAEDIVPFVILPDIDTALTVVTDRTNYSAKEDVAITLDITNKGENYIIPAMDVSVKIVDVEDNEFFTEDEEIINLLPGMRATLNSRWNIGLNPPGDYRAVVEIYLDGQMLSMGSASFTIDETVKIAGDITVTPSAVIMGHTAEADYTARNDGNVDLTDLTVKVLIIDPETEEIKTEFSRRHSADMGETISGIQTISTSNLSLKAYLAILQYSYQGDTKNIATTSFTVRDGIPPMVNIISPDPGSFYNSGFDISVTAADDASGVDSVQYRTDNGTWKLLPVSDRSSGRYSTTWVPVKSDEGTHAISFRAIEPTHYSLKPFGHRRIIRIDMGQ